jgi:hypothetical protein
MSAWEGSAWQAAQEAEKERKEREKLSGVARKVIAMDGRAYFATAAKQEAASFNVREAERVARDEQEGKKAAQAVLELVVFDKIRDAAKKGQYVVRLSDYEWPNISCGSHYLIEALKEYGYRAEVARPCMDPGTEFIIRWE